MPAWLIELIWIVAALGIAGVLLWGLDQFPAMNATIKQIIKVLVVVIVAIWVILRIVAIVQTIR